MYNYCMKGFFLIIWSIFFLSHSFADTLVGYSYEKRPIHVHTYGQGEKKLLIIGGIHGGYEWNTIQLCFELMEYFKNTPPPTGVEVHIIPNANPDGLYELLKMDRQFSASLARRLQKGFKEKGGIHRFKGRFNGNGVDLNRNWGYNWKPKGLVGNVTVQAGDKPFSEPETRALWNYAYKIKPYAVVFYHSAFGAVFSASSGPGMKTSRQLSRLYSSASGYPWFREFSAYEVTGDAAEWLSQGGFPTIDIELTDHQNTEFIRNLKGVLALLRYNP